MSRTPFGHFSGDAREYCITAPFAPPRAQVNFLWNDTVISGLNQFGGGDGVFNGQTLLYNHPEGRVRLIRDGRRYFYIKDEESGEIWNSALFPLAPTGSKLETRIGLGYSIFASEYEGISCESRVFLAPDEPVEIWEFRLENNGPDPRRLSFVPYVEWLLGGYPTFSSPYSYLRSAFHSDLRCVAAYNTSDERPHERYNGFLATDADISGWCGGRRDFLGPFGTPSAPRALIEGRFASCEAWCEELASAVRIPVELGVGEMREICVLVGSFDTGRELARLVGKTAEKAYRLRAWDNLQESKERMLRKVWVETPDESISRLVNVWAKQQIQLCVEFGRDGARGFRDTLQDAWGILPFNAPLAKSKILETLRHQYSDGHAVRGWLPLQAHHYSDGPAWITPAVVAYLQETGDLAFLDIRVPFLDGGEASVFEHMLAGVRHLASDLGAHGLVLAHEGDWNDSLNWMGRNGKGESVWTSMALYHSQRLLERLAEEVLGDPGLAAEMRAGAEAMRAEIDGNGWDGDWYLAGWSDLGNPVGSRQNPEGSTFLNTQTWAILTGLATGERLEKCWKAIDEILESEHGSLTLWPPYTKRDENSGRVSMLLPGMYENGTPYCHGTAFKIVADIVGGRPDIALASWKKVMPDGPGHPSSVSGCEPYAFTNQYLGPTNGRAGDSISGWITGSAGWMFRAVLEYFCGVRPDYRGLEIRPCLPSGWGSVSIKRNFRGKDYDIAIARAVSGKISVSVNGVPCPGGFVAVDP